MPKTLAEGSSESRDGRIVTFYSYKGGTGRTMALANVAWILAANGRRVLVADWDLESPGLHRFFHPFLDEDDVRDASGIIDLIRQYERAAAEASGPDEARRLIGERARTQPHALSLTWEFPDGGGLDFLSAGRQNLDYAATLAGLDWDNFYERLNGGEFIDAVRADMKRHYDYILIDSRTGLSDTASICTVELPDVLVDCFTFSTQGIEGAAQVARDIEQNYKHRNIRILPVPMRVDPAEKEKVEAGHAVAVRLFAGLPAGLSEAQRREYWAAVEVPYRAFYAYEETLAIFGDAPGSPASLLSSFERITAQITDGAVTALPPMDDYIRNRTKLQFTRSAPLAGDQMIVEYGPEDQVWGEWIADVLEAAGVLVTERRLDEPGTENLRGTPRTLTVVSAGYLARHRAEQPLQAAPDLPVYVTAARPPATFSVGVSIAGVPEKEAVERLHRLVGVTTRPAFEHGGIRAVRYPGAGPRINTAPVRNVRFTGREDDLRQLRELLRARGAAVLPVTLQGLGGIGKTQVAIEYVNRFRTDYDLIWWLDCGQPQFIDASLTDLGVRMREDFSAGAPLTANAAEAARRVRQLLEQDREGLRWLLVFDNADDIGEVRPYLPSGGGDVLITSRNRDWEDHARSLQVDVFAREESVEHLRKRVPSIEPQEADEVAELLGDLPLAVATAGAWLAESGMTVANYKLELERRAPLALSFSHLADYPQKVSETWDLSLKLLEDRSPAAARFFELCSVMAPNIALELLHSSAMASVLEPFDPELVEPMAIGKLVREVDRLALIKIDHNSGQILVHRLVQQVVQGRMEPDDVAAARRDVHQVLAAARPSRSIDNPETWDRFRMLWPHLEPAQAVTSLEEPVRRLMIDRVRYLRRRSALELGRATGREVEKAWEAMLAAGPEPRLADSLRRQLLQLRFSLANILREQASFAQAKALDEEVLEEQRKLLGANHPHTLMTAGSLAADLRATGDYRAALEMDSRTYPSWTEHYDEGNAGRLAAANNLAVSYRLTGDFGTALRLDEETLQRRHEALGPLHPQTLLSTSNVVHDMLEVGHYAEAVAMARELRKSYVDVLGADSVDALKAEMLLGVALRNAGQPGDAEPHFQSAYEGLVRRSGSASSESLACRLGHAVNHLAIDRPAEAEAEIREVLAVYQQRLGPAHPHTLVCLVDLSCALRKLERYAQAVQTLRQAIEGLRDVLGEAHPYTLAAMSAMGVLLAEQGELEQAEQIEALVAERLLATLGRGHPDTMRSQANRLLTREQLRVTGAGAERKGTLDELAAALGPGHPDIATLRREGRLMHALDPQPF
jgi:tetratricopeptide (TPR) repeat protein/cellulose biosynthesis protein BcsQ